MSNEINQQRRRLLGAAAMTAAAFQFGVASPAKVQASAASPLTTAKTGPQTSFEALKQIDADVLDVGYAEAGPANGPAVFLLHGWPYDIYSFIDVAPIVASAGYRVIIPYLRGYGTT